MAARENRTLTGRHVFLMLVAFFGVMIIVNIIFTVMAVKSFTGEDVPKSYRQGLEYNQTLETRREQSGLGWSVSANSYQTDGFTQIVVRLEDQDAKALSGFSIEGVLRHPTDKAFDQSLSFQDTGLGRYAAKIKLPAGQWQLKAKAIDEAGQSLNFTHDLWVK